MEEQRRATRRREGDLYGATEELVGGVARLGYGLLSLSLALLPRQTRAHMENAVRELSYGFARLPADFATIAGAEIERWAAESDGAGPPPAAHRHPPAEHAQHLRVEFEPAAPAGAPRPDPAPAPASSPSPLDQVEVVVSKESVSAVGIAFIEYDPPGDDLAGEYVAIRNTSGAPVELAGWRLSDADGRHSFVFPPFSLGPGAEVKVWTKAGVSDGANLYWGSTRPIWNNTGDSGTLADASGAVVSSYSYGGER